MGIAVVIAGNRNDGRGVVIVGLVELAVVVGDLPVEVDDIAEVIEETRQLVG